MRKVISKWRPEQQEKVTLYRRREQLKPPQGGNVKKVYVVKLRVKRREKDKTREVLYSRGS